MEAKYFKPRSVSWWAGVALAGLGIARGLADGLPQLAPAATVIDAWTGGIGPSVLIAQGASIIGLRARL